MRSIYARSSSREAYLHSTWSPRSSQWLPRAPSSSTLAPTLTDISDQLKPQVNRVNVGIGFVARWYLLVHGVRPAALEGREAFTTRSGERFYWVEDLLRRRGNGCEYISGDLNGDWSRCNEPKVQLQYCAFHYRVCHLKKLSTEELLKYLLASIPYLKPKS